MVLKRARFGELFLRLSDPTRVALRPLKIGIRSDSSWTVAIEARVLGKLGSPIEACKCLPEWGKSSSLSASKFKDKMRSWL
jgi:hypothetical protein